jgi:hypothetical protein
MKVEEVIKEEEVQVIAMVDATIPEIKDFIKQSPA